MANRTIAMELVGEPDSASTVVTARTLPALSGNGSTDYTCGGCHVVIAASLKLGEIDGVLFRCPGCGRVNRVK
jgi:hypothetical protein